MNNIRNGDPQTSSCAGGGSERDNAGSAVKSEFTIITVTCTGISPSGKAFFARSKSGTEAPFPFSTVEVMEGVLERGKEVKIKVPSWLLESIRAKVKLREVRFTDKVVVTGVLVDRSEKALYVRADADMIERWVALSKIEVQQGATVPGEAVRLLVPAWMLRHTTGQYPSWVRGATING